MLLRRISVGAAPVSLAEAKEHLRVTHSLEDDLITALVAAACESISQQSGRAITSEVWTIYDTGFSGVVHLPKSPVTALGSVKYYLDGTLATATLADYRLYQDDDYSRVAPIDGKAWPVSQTREDGSQITFTAGYTTIPDTLRMAVLLLVDFLYYNRGGDGDTMPPPGIEQLVGLHRLGWASA